MPSIMKGDDIMFDVYFSYFDGNEYLCKNVSRIAVRTSSGIKEISGDDLLSYAFKFNSELNLYSDSACYALSCSNLKALEIRKH